MNLLQSLSLYIRIVERGGLAAAGRDLGLSAAVVSERLATLEEHYGARLINRTTRSLSLTDEGRLLLDGARQLISDASEMEARIKWGVDRVSGPIRMSVPIDLGRHFISQILDQFMETHPYVNLELLLSDSYADLAAQGIDLAVRLGDLKDSSLHAVRLAPSRRLVCASPNYIKRHGAPIVPRDLLDHNCLLMRFGAGLDREWTFSESGKRFSILVNGNRISNDGSLVRKWCVEGHGISLKLYWDVREDLASGQLIELLKDYACVQNSIHLVYQGGVSLPKRVRALIDTLIEAFARENVP